MVQIAQFNQLDGSEVLRMIRISSLVSQAVAPLNYDSDLLQLTKVAIYKLPSMSTSYCHNYPFGTEVGCHGASTWSKKGQRCRVERRANSQWENQEKATIQMPPVIQKQNSCKLSFFFLAGCPSGFDHLFNFFEECFDHLPTCYLQIQASCNLSGHAINCTVCNTRVMYLFFTIRFLSKKDKIDIP